jgi:hypothetical protein
LIIISVLQFTAAICLPLNITEVPYFTILFINLLVTTRSPVLNPQTFVFVLFNGQADNHAFGVSLF